MSRRQRPLSLVDDEDDGDLSLDSQISPVVLRRQKPWKSAATQRPSTWYSDDIDVEDSPPVTRRTTKPNTWSTEPQDSPPLVRRAPVSSRVTRLPAWTTEPSDSPPIARRTPVAARVVRIPAWNTEGLDSPSHIRKVPQVTYVRQAYPRSDLLYDLSDEEPLDTSSREILTWQRMFDPMTTRFPGRDVVADARQRSLSPEERSTALRYIDQSSEDYDDALIQRSRQARVGKQTSLRPWQLRIPKFVPAAELRQAQPKPEVRKVRGRSLRTEEKILISYHIARGKLGSTTDTKKTKEVNIEEKKTQE